MVLEPCQSPHQSWYQLKYIVMLTTCSYLQQSCQYWRHTQRSHHAVCWQTCWVQYNLYTALHCSIYTFCHSNMQWWNLPNYNCCRIENTSLYAVWCHTYDDSGLMWCGCITAKLTVVIFNCDCGLTWRDGHTFQCLSRRWCKIKKKVL